MHKTSRPARIRLAEKIKTIFKSSVTAEILFMGVFLGALMLKCFYFQFTTHLNVRPFLSAFNINMLKASFGVSIIILSVFLLLFDRKRKSALLFINIFFSILLFSETLYYRYYYNPITVPVLYQVGLVGSVTDSALSLLKKKDIIYILDFPFLAAFLLVSKQWLKIRHTKIKIGLRFIAFLLLFASGSFLVRFAYKKTDYINFAYDNNYVANSLGILYFHYYDIKRFVKDNYLTDRNLSQKEMEMLSDYFEKKAKTGEKYKGLARGKNLIIVQVEALQNFVINLEYNGQEVTPNLNRYINESVYFNNFFYQIGGGNTADAEFLCNTSLYPVRDGSVYFRFPTNTYHSLPKLLKKEGYNTYVAHANNPSFWNRTVMYESLGFDAFFSNKDFIIDEVLGWGLSDLSFFKQTLDKIDMTKPFYTFLITLSSHHPYIYFENYTGFDAGELEKTFMGNYLKAMNYLDFALAEFINELKQRGIYEDTILVIYGDHAGIQKEHVEILEKITDYKDSDFDWAMLQKVPCFIHCPGLDQKGTNDTFGGEIDLLPTIVNLLGLDYPYSLGKDLFNTEDSYAVLRNGNIVTEKYVYLNAHEKTYDHSGNIIDINEYKSEIKSLQRVLSISELIVRKDAFKKMNNK